MSRYDWESGNIIIPRGEWAKIKKSFRETWNQRQESHLKAAVEIYQFMKTQKWKTLTHENKEKLPYSLKDYAKNAGDEFIWKIDEILCKTLRKPTLQDFPKVKSSHTTYHEVDAGVHFDDKTRTISWRVSENNHAVENAHDGLLYKTLMKLLKPIKWTRGTGGHFQGNDEYNREQREAGYGSNYLTDTFGPLGDAALVDDYVRKGSTKAHAIRMVKEKNKKSADPYGNFGRRRF